MNMRWVGLGLLAGAGVFAAAQGRHFSADDLPKVVRIADPQISPDGRTIAVVVARANLKEDRYDAEVDLLDIATKQLRVMTHERQGVGQVRWSADGTRLAFLALDANKKAQIFVLPVTGGEAAQLTHSKTGVTLLAWRPDGKALAYAAVDEEPERKDEARFDDAFEVGNNDYLERARVLPTHLWTVDAMDGTAKRLTQGTWSLPNHFAPAGPPSQLEWTPDGRSLIFVKADSPITGDAETSRLEILDVTTGSMHDLTQPGVAAGNPVLSPDGSRLAYSYPRGGERRNEEAVYVMPLIPNQAGGTGTDAAFALDHAVGGAAWLPDGKGLVLSGTDGTKNVFWRQPLGGEARRLDVGAINPAGSANIGRDGAMAFTATDASTPPELYYAKKIGEKPVRMTHLQTVTDGMTLGRQETVTWTSDSFTVDGVLTYPPGYVAGRKLPLVLYLHGGPTAASLESFSTPAQIFAGQGWLVFEPNYRGSNNEGNAFNTAIVKDAGAGPGRDVMAGVKLLESRGIVDETKIAVSGWSYGGYMTSWLIGNYPEVWKVAVAGAPVTDLVDQYNAERQQYGACGGLWTFAVCGRQPEGVSAAIADHLCVEGEGADADHERCGRLARGDDAGVQALPCAQG